GDLKDELVMLGGHFDSWHGGTGATDNAVGCGVALEAVRILQSLGIKPRRTIRLALWTGEEQGLLGSKAYVTDHFGRAITPPPTGGRGGRGPQPSQPNQQAAAQAAEENKTAEPTAANQPAPSGGRRGGGQPPRPSKYELKPEHA